MALVAHSRNQSGQLDSLEHHLRFVADLAANHAKPFGGEDVARWAGLLHDIGKASQQWQDYLAACERDPNRKHKTVDHKSAGSLRSQEILGQLAFLIQGHHGGLRGLGSVKSALKESAQEPKASMIAEAIARVEALGLLATGSTPPNPPFIPDFAKTNERSLEFFLRMCFSALVDADHFATEQHFNPEKAAHRGDSLELASLARKLETSQQLLLREAEQTENSGQKIVQALRSEVYHACENAAQLSPGFFRLTVPTGGGKTRSGLTFALKHALHHNLKRVIVAVPYLSITDQTASTFHSIFDDDRVVLEHHSGVSNLEDDDGVPTPQETWRQLASQDWDAPIIVTTTVQLFESLFGRTTTVCRKLHRIAESVIILDEAQTLPFHLRTPIFDILNELVAHYRVSVVLCTATQPSLQSLTESISKVDIREIAPDPPRLFRTLQRVAYQWPARDEKWDWREVAEVLKTSDQAMVVLNTISNALSVLEALDDPDAFHLSTLLCGAHRRDVLKIIRERLAQNLPCRVVSTQVVEAGVDLDFPLVLRALGPLDRIVQAAGRCNREGKRDRGRVVVFDPLEGSLPAGAYRTATHLTIGLLHSDDLDLNHPDTFPKYFQELSVLLPGDREHIQDSRKQFDFEKVATDFRMIDNDTASVFVKYTGLNTSETNHQEQSVRHQIAVTVEEDEFKINHMERSAQLLADLQRGISGKNRFSGQNLLQRAQPYLVSVRRSKLEYYAKNGLVTPLFGDLWEWRGTYDNVKGIGDAALDPTVLYCGG